MTGPNTLEGSDALKAALAMPCPKGWDRIEADDCADVDDQDAFADDASCIEEGDWTTSDGCIFYADGEIVLDTTDMSDAQAARAAGRIMRSEGFFPNIWVVSDHGNVSSFTFE
jgi:hypothetical protein